MSVQIGDMIKKCIETEQFYKSLSEQIADFSADQKNLSKSKTIVDFVKATIKSKKHTSLQKVYALKLLHKCVMRKNKEFAKYVEKKILKRLVIYGEFNKDKTSGQELIYKGELIFSNTETDRKSAATFLILLLDCLEKWGQAFQQYDDGKYTMMCRQYQGLVSKGIKFPSQLKNERSANSNAGAEVVQGVPVNRNMAVPPKTGAQAAGRGQSEAGGSQKQQNIKKAEELKKQMLRAKDINKKGLMYLQKLEKMGFEYDRKEMLSMDQQLAQGRELCENCILQLTTEEMNAVISNAGELLDKMIQYQEQLLNSLAMLAPHVEEVKRIGVDNISPPKTNKKSAPYAPQNFQTSAVSQQQPQIQPGLLDIDFSVFNDPNQNQSSFDTSANSNFFGNFGNQQPQHQQYRAHEEKKDEEEGDLWSQLDQFTNQFQTQKKQDEGVIDQSQIRKQTQKIEPNINSYQNQQPQIQQQIQSQKQQPPSPAKKGGLKLHEMVGEHDPFDDAVQDQQQQQQQQLQIEYNQNDNQQYNNHPQNNYDFGFNQQQQQQQQHNQQQNNYQQQNEGTWDIDNSHNQYGQQYQYSQQSQMEVNISPKQQQHQQQQQHNPPQQQQENQMNPGGKMCLWDENIHQYHQEDHGNDHNNVLSPEQDRINRLKERINDLENDLKSQKRISSDLAIDNRSLKDQLENQPNSSYHNQSNTDNDQQVYDLQLQLQGLETSMNNQKHYYDQEIHQMTVLIEEKDRLIYSLRQENEKMQRNRNSQVQEQQPFSHSHSSVGSGIQKQNSDNESPAKLLVKLKKEQSKDKVIEEHGSPLSLPTDFKTVHKSMQNLEKQNSQNNSHSRDQEEEVQQQQQVQQQPPKQPKDKKSLILKQIDNFFFQGLFSDKGVIYEDLNIQLGYIRSVSTEWRQATLRVFVGNKSETQIITSFLLDSDSQFVTIKAEESTQPPGEVGPKQQIEVKIFISALIQGTPQIQLSYEFGDKKSGSIMLKLPVNPMFFAEPHPMMGAYFKQIWEQWRNEKEQVFDLDLQRASNLQQIKKIATLEDKHGSLVTQVDPQPNIISFASYHLEAQVLMKIELSATGHDCRIKVRSEGDTHHVAQAFMSCMLDIIEQR